MKIKKLWHLLFIILLVLMLTAPANLTPTEASPGMADVLVTFYQPPGPDEIELIESLGGIVKTVYHIVPANPLVPHSCFA